MTNTECNAWKLPEGFKEPQGYYHEKVRKNYKIVDPSEVRKEQQAEKPKPEEKSREQSLVEEIELYKKRVAELETIIAKMNKNYKAVASHDLDNYDYPFTFDQLVEANKIVLLAFRRRV